MTAKKDSPTAAVPSRWYRGADVPMRVIRRFARQVAQRFSPDKIILFGSYAWGRPHADSDVDILVIMPTRNQLDQAFRIHTRIDPPFPLDIIVRTPRNMGWLLAEGDYFLQEILSKGLVLYEKADGGLGEKKPRPITSGVGPSGEHFLTITTALAFIVNKRQKSISRPSS